MNQEPDSERDTEMLEEYDFNGGVRGKYVGRFPQGDKVLLDPAVAEVFSDSESDLSRKLVQPETP